MKNEIFRNRTIDILRERKLEPPINLPLLSEMALRPLSEILDRLLCLHALAAVAHGFNGKDAQSWLMQENLWNQVSAKERIYVKIRLGDSNRYRLQVEAIWALAWSIQIVEDLNFWEICNDSFVELLPNLKTLESSERFRSSAKLRSENEIRQALDIAYCLNHTSKVSNFKIARKSKGLAKDVIEERLRALEWLTGQKSWETFSIYA